MIDSYQISFIYSAFQDRGAVFYSAWRKIGSVDNPDVLYGLHTQIKIELSERKSIKTRYFHLIHLTNLIFVSYFTLCITTRCVPFAVNAL